MLYDTKHALPVSSMTIHYAICYAIYVTCQRVEILRWWQMISYVHGFIHSN